MSRQVTPFEEDFIRMYVQAADNEELQPALSPGMGGAAAVPASELGPALEGAVPEVAPALAPEAAARVAAAVAAVAEAGGTSPARIAPITTSPPCAMKLPPPFRVAIDKSGDRKIGLDVRHYTKESLEILYIKDGLVFDYNQLVRDGSLSGREVQANDVITMVNGYRGTANQLLGKIATEKRVELLIQRGLPKRVPKSREASRGSGSAEGADDGAEASLVAAFAAATAAAAEASPTPSG